MGAPAISPRTRPARKTAPRPQPAPRSKPETRRPASRTKPATRSNRSKANGSRSNVAMFPVNAVGGLADCGVVVGMSKSRVWIVVLGVLLGGIVAMNVVGLSLSASGSRTALKIDALQQDNGVLQGRIATRLSNDRVAVAATALGLAVPAPDAVNYLKYSSADAKAAAERLANGSIANAPPTLTPSEASSSVANPDPTATTVTAPIVVPATVTPIDPTATTVTDPTAAPTTTVTP